MYMIIKCLCNLDVTNIIFSHISIQTVLRVIYSKNKKRYRLSKHAVPCQSFNYPAYSIYKIISQNSGVTRQQKALMAAQKSFLYLRLGHRLADQSLIYVPKQRSYFNTLNSFPQPILYQRLEREQRDVIFVCIFFSIVNAYPWTNCGQRIIQDNSSFKAVWQVELINK